MAEENKEKTTQSSTPDKKSGSGKKGTNVVVIVVVILVALGIAGYFGVRYLFQKAGEKVGEELVENALESSTGSDVEYDYDDDGATIENEDGTASTGSMAEWPSDMPSSVPMFDQGTINYSSTAEGSWSVMYEEIDSSNLDTYKSLLEDAGWTIVETSNSTNSGQSIQAENDTYDLFIMAFEDGKSATLTVTEK